MDTTFGRIQNGQDSSYSKSPLESIFKKHSRLSRQKLDGYRDTIQPVQTSSRIQYFLKYKYGLRNLTYCMWEASMPRRRLTK